MLGSSCFLHYGQQRAALALVCLNVWRGIIEVHVFSWLIFSDLGGKWNKGKTKREKFVLLFQLFPRTRYILILLICLSWRRMHVLWICLFLLHHSIAFPTAVLFDILQRQNVCWSSASSFNILNIPVVLQSGLLMQNNPNYSANSFPESRKCLGSVSPAKLPQKKCFLGIWKRKCIFHF